MLKDFRELIFKPIIEFYQRCSPLLKVLIILLVLIISVWWSWPHIRELPGFSQLLSDSAGGIQVSEPYRVKIQNFFKEHRTKSLVTDFSVRHKSSEEDFLSPVHFILFLELTNLQNVRTTIEDLRVDAATTQSGPWKRLMPIPTRGRKVYLRNRENLKRAQEISFVNNALEDLIYFRKSLKPRDPVTGYMLLERNDVPKDSIAFFRFYVEDSVGAKSTLIEQVAGRNEGVLKPMESEFFAIKSIARVDISSLPNKLYFSSYPD